MKKILILFFLISCVFAQVNQNEIEVYLIDSYVKNKVKPIFKLSYYTSDFCKSKIILDGKYEISITDSLSDEHKADIDLSEFELSSSNIFYEVYVSQADSFYLADKIELALNFDMKEVQKMNYSLFKMCCIGGTVFGMPYPTYIITDDEEYFGVTKEIALLTFSGNDFNYPNGYIGAEYAHIFRADKIKNLLRIGYKHIFVIPGIEFLSSGVSGFTNFSGTNGVSFEVSAGLIKISSVFTIYARYRYNLVPVNNGFKFQEFTIGFYSDFFSLNL